MKLGRPYTDYTLLVDLLAKAGVEVGDLNHSRDFISRWGPKCGEVIKQRVQNFFKTRLPQTGRLPHAKVTTDKATYKHRTRMVSGLITVVPDSDQPIQGFLISCGVSTAGSGDEQAAALFEQVTSYIEGSQFLGTSADGHTVHCGVGPKLGQLLGKEGINDYDPMHKAGRIEDHMRKQPGLEFINKITEVISEVFNFVNFGQEFENFFNSFKKLQLLGAVDTFLLPKFFSDTRFANFSFRVFLSFVKNFAALILTLAEAQELAFSPGSTAAQKKKADKCAGMQAQIQNWLFIFTLVGLTDLYTVYSKGVNVLQIVNILPHEKYDAFETSCRGRLVDMIAAFYPEDCACSKRTQGEEETPVNNILIAFK